NAPDKNCEDITTTSTVTITTNSSLPIYRIAYPSYQLCFKRTKGKKLHPPNEGLTKSHDFITRDCSPSIQLNENSTSHNMISSIIDQSSSVESNQMSTCCLTNTTQIATNTISTISRARRKASTSSHMNLSRSYDSYITSNSLHPALRSAAVSGGIVSNSHLLNLDRWQHVRCENVLPYSQQSSQLHTLLSRVPSIGVNSDNSSTSGFTTVTSLPSVRERCMESYDTTLSTTDRSDVLSIPVTPGSSRSRTQSFNEEQRTKLSFIDNGHFRQYRSPMNDGTNYNVNREDSDEVVCLHDNPISRCRTMDVILSNEQPSQSSWSIVTPQHFTLRSCNSVNRRTSGILSLSGSASQTLPFTRRKSTTTLYSTSNTPIHSTKFNSNTYSRNSTTYATSSLVSGAYFPFGVGSNSHRIPISAGQRRWALVRPSDEYGSTITPHCIITSTDGIDFLYPAALPYNLCQIWTLYFDFLRTRLLDKRDSKHNKQSYHSNQNSVKHNNYTTSNMNNTTTISNNYITHPVSDIQQFNIRNTNVRISTKGLPGYIERTSGNQNTLNDHLPLVPPTYTNFNSFKHNINVSKPYLCNNYNQVSSITSPSAASIHQHQQHNYTQSAVMHDKIGRMKPQENSNLSQLSENSMQILRNLLQTIKNAMFAYSTQLSALATPSLSTTFWYQNIITVNNNNKSSDDQNLSNLQTNNFNKSTNYKLMIPKRVGVDWKSLIVPACLPVDTDYFPDTHRLRSEWYTLHDYRVVPSGMSPDEWVSVNNHGLVEPGALYNRRQLTAHEVFQEMVLQRISQGFQLCHEVVHNPTNSNNVEHHCVTSINTSPTILQNDTLSSSSSNKTKTLSVVKQTNERHSSSNSPHSLYNSRRAPNISTTTINTTTNSYSSTNRNAINTQFLKSTNLYLPTRALKLTTVNNSNNNNPQYSRGSASAYNGRVLGVGLTINPSTRSGSQSSSCNNTGRVVPAMRPANHNTNSKHDSSMINAMVNPLSKFGDTDHLLKTSNTRKLSIGHLFHLISLDEDSIAVTSYRQIDKLIKISYSYALQVPDAKSYVSFHTNFTSDSTVILNWNYLDNYLCNRGISDSFRLLPNLKFWRSRFFVLPIFSNETRRLTEAIRDNLTGQRIPCDVYESDYMNINREKTCEKFVHFIESINRVRRVLITSRKLNRQPTIEKSDVHRSNNTVFSSNAATTTFDTAPSMHCATFNKLKTTNSLTTTTYTRSPVIISVNTTGSLNETNEQNIQLISSRTVNQASMVKTDNFCSTTSLPNISGMSYQSTEDQTINSGQIVHNTPTIINTSLLNSNTKNVYYLVALMMVDNDNGLPFISATTTDAFPNYTFISIDAVNWIIKWFPDDIGSIEQAVLYLQQMLEAGWICHTSGNTKHAFIYGTYFYTLLIPDVNQLTCTQVETLDNNELNVHSAPVTPIQLNTSTSTTTTVTPLGTSSNTIHCLPSPTSIVPATNHNNAIILNNLPTSTNTTIQLGSITNTISSFAAVTPSTCTNTTINSTITNVLLSTATTTTNSSLLSTVKQNELTKNLPIHSFKTLSNIVDLNVLQQSPMQFPKDYIPKLLSDTTKWTRVFQNEWAEISIVHYGSNECQLKQHQQQNTSSKQINDNNNNHSSGGTSSLPTSPTTSTTTTHVSCPSVSTSEIHFEHVKEELYSFFKDGLLTYSSISALFGILDKTGFQEIDQILRKSCLCDLDGPNNDGPVEWAHCVYDANYHPTCAFSIELQWLVVSGGRMAELVNLFSYYMP
ncbi:GATOR complex protein, partial [Schistosoma japonicum]